MMRSVLDERATVRTTDGGAVTAIVPLPLDGRPGRRDHRWRGLGGRRVGVGDPRIGHVAVTAVGTVFIDEFAASLKELAVEWFGTNDKPALITGVVITSLLLGTALGVASIRRRWILPTGIVVFGAVGAWAIVTDPLGSWSDALAMTVPATLAGVATAIGLVRRRRPVDIHDRVRHGAARRSTRTRGSRPPTGEASSSFRVQRRPARARR